MRRAPYAVMALITMLCTVSMAQAQALGSSLSTPLTDVAAAPTITSLQARGDTVIGMSATAPGAAPAANTQVRPRLARPFLSTKSSAASSLVSPASTHLHAPSPVPFPILSQSGSAVGFQGISELDQAEAGTGPYAGTQFSVEPPDQALAVGNGFVVEGVNAALAVYDAKSHALLAGPTPYNQFFNVAPELTIGNPSSFGPDLFDPRLYFDPATQRWFATAGEVDVDPVTGNFASHSHLELAVSTSADPTQTWRLFSLDTTNDGSGCPCANDQPLLGADANGIYVSSNTGPITGQFVTGATLYAMSKVKLEAGVAPPVVRFSGLQAGGTPAFAPMPATSPPGTPAESSHSGVEYYMSSLDPNGTLDNRLAVWAMTNTLSLNDPAPLPALTNVVIQSEVYGQPPEGVAQKAGPTPLGSSIPEPLEEIATDDDRMNQVVFSSGMLWGGLNTVLGNGTNAGIAYFMVQPVLLHDRFTARIANQGYITAHNDSVIYPSIGVNSSGTGVVAYTLVGPDRYPSTAYSPIGSLLGTLPAIQVIAAGAAPEDGFSGYAAFQAPLPGVARWGDYTAAVADADGSVWFGIEYIPGGPRDEFADWGTFIGRASVGCLLGSCLGS